MQKRETAQQKADRRRWLRYGIGGCVQRPSKTTGAQFNAAMVAYYKAKEGK